MFNLSVWPEQFAPELRPTISLPNIIREGCQEDAYDMVNRNNSTGEYNMDNPKILALISSFTSLMLHIKQLSDGVRYVIMDWNICLTHYGAASTDVAVARDGQCGRCTEGITHTHASQEKYSLLIFRNSYELEALQQSLAEVKNSIDAQNIGKFENCVEVHMKHIQSGLSQVSYHMHCCMRKTVCVVFTSELLSPE